ncbi:hypothetical protein AVEN_242799-1 [Araneus ventricosus]|uniref:RNase H type-1 domain-containing protein n=1 Tax=Araneus ventricosus TaxID=182803 RepID=A0A4Y2P8E5_ARAVE|nr:hypothetical protein AVEN_242799-1 [Araneus ventricosus]
MVLPVRHTNTKDKRMRSPKKHDMKLLARSIQDSLYNTHNIRLCWIRAHVGHLGNEKADELAKEAITSAEAAVLMVPLPRSSAKQDLKQRELAKWQSRLDDGINGCSTYEIIKKVGHRNHNWSRQLIQFITGHGPFPSYLFRFEKKPGQQLCLWRTWHDSSLCHQVPPHAFLPPQVSSRSTHKSLDEINYQPPPANKQNNPR